MTPAEARAVAVAHRGAAVGWARSYGLAPAAAEDVAHDALETMLKKASEIERPAAAAWLRTAVLHKAREYQRRQREVLVDKLPERSSDETPEETLRSAQVAQRVQSALARVPASRRELVREVLGEERTVVNVAREQGIPESAARVRLRDGAEDLRGELHRQRVVERRKTGGHSSWLVLLGLQDVRALARRVAALGVAAAGGALLHSLVAGPELGPTHVELPARAAIVVPLAQPATATAERGVERPEVPVELRPRARHDVAAHMLRQRLRPDRY